jgi:hypothetical protein
MRSICSLDSSGYAATTSSTRALTADNRPTQRSSDNSRGANSLRTPPLVVVRTSPGWPSTLKCDGVIITALYDRKFRNPHAEFRIRADQCGIYRSCGCFGIGGSVAACGRPLRIDPVVAAALPTASAYPSISTSRWVGRSARQCAGDGIADSSSGCRCHRVGHRVVATSMRELGPRGRQGFVTVS